MRVLVASHGHPAVTRGGAEMAAYTQFQALCVETGVEAFFLGCQRGRPEPCLGEPITQPFEDAREYLYVGGAFDWFRLTNHDAAFPRAFTALLHTLRPDVLHLHHVLEFGVESLLLARRALPGLRIVLTLHEYLLICHNHGQMVKRPSRTLCTRARPDECHACFPEFAPSDFVLRTLYLRRFLDLADEFIAPSRFLARRLIEWGLPETRILVRSNAARPGRANLRRSNCGMVVVGFFGQISALKGVGLLLDAATILREAGRRDIWLEIHGTMAGQPPELLDDLPARLAAPPSNVRVVGPYLPEYVDGLMSGVDAVCVPSLWWENAPTVMVEAHANGRTVICADIGGMAEHAAEKDLLFRAGVAADLAAVIEKFADGLLSEGACPSDHACTTPTVS